MALLSFFKTPKHQQFEYKPRYWNPRKEELERRLDLVHKSQEGNPDAMKARISTGLRRQYQSDSKSRSQQNFRRSMLLIAVIVALIFISYLFLTVYLPELVNMIEG